MIDTVFGVYHYANELSGGRLLSHLREDPKSVHMGLKILTKNLRRYAQATIDTGCEGIYYALSGASGDAATVQEYLVNFKKYDHSVLESVIDAPFNILHLHGYDDLHFEVIHDLPADAVCWSDRAGGPSLRRARKIHNGCLMGGIDEKTFGEMTPKQIESQGQEAILEAGKQNFILSPGCSVPNNTCRERLMAIQAAAMATA
jgi:uroporphyrinogen decarboxylase